MRNYECTLPGLTLIYVEALEIFFMLMRDIFLLLFPRRPQVRTMFYACVQLTLIACVSNGQSSCVVAENGSNVWYYSMTSSSLQA